MSTESPMIILCRVVACTVVALWLVGCSNNVTTPAPIRAASNKNVIQKSAERKKTPQGVINKSVIDKTPVKSPIIYNRSYDTIPKGSYNGDTYTVNHGDTLFYVAWITGNDYRDLASKNNIAEPYHLNVGQSIKLGNGSEPKTSSPLSNKIPATTIDFESTNRYSANPSKQNVGTMLPKSSVFVAKSAISTPNSPKEEASNHKAMVEWKWPADGKIIGNYDPNGNKGIEIAGKRNQSIFAAAKGRVVYSGNALRGYGNLIIIKHSDDYLSAYAHNDAILVKEKQEVVAGQEIATMGNTGTHSVRLHFEIRYQGKSVNPLRYLPQR
ncbi:murein hydrolase activator NlpD [Candidatus Regiella endosymbiont of Tuberolachnus salignus]|uniref:murein hydrolase activator NlpD n=1 Tax=Candidatus Regiella endosymbiont of Tuberolachnus salignus TaxID=3077956 RepID=UPI003BAFD350